MDGGRAREFVAQQEARDRRAADLLAREFPELSRQGASTVVTGRRLLHDASERAGRPLGLESPDDLEHLRAVAREFRAADRKMNRGRLHARVLDF